MKKTKDKLWGKRTSKQEKLMIEQQQKQLALEEKKKKMGWAWVDVAPRGKVFMKVEKIVKQ